MRYNILICCALKQELDVYKDMLKDFASEDMKIFFLQTGVGNYNTLYTLQEYLSNHKIHFILNLGVCGYVQDDREVSQSIQVARIYNLARKKESLVPPYIQFAQLISIASSEKIVTKSQELDGEKYVDMESYGVDFVATKMKIPYAIVKIPLDMISQESKNVDIQELIQKCHLLDVRGYLEKIQDFCKKQEYDDEDVTKYSSFFRFTFSENEIFKTQKNKFGAFGIDFEKFFSENKQLHKKEFLKKMQQIVL